MVWARQNGRVSEPVRVDDPADPRLSDYFDLRDPEGRRRTEQAEGFFVAEGITVLGRLLESPHRLRSVLLLPNRHDRLAPLLDTLEAPVYVVTREVMAAVAGFDLHRGVVASADRPRERPIGELLAPARLVVVTEGLNDPENLGAIARSARAFGADALLLDPTCADPLARRTVRVSMGEILHLAVGRITNWPAGLVALHEHGFTVAALTPSSDATSIHALAHPARLALLLGAEGSGLSEQALKAASVRVRIPIDPGVDSLNVGHAAAVALALLGPLR